MRVAPAAGADAAAVLRGLSADPARVRADRAAGGPGPPGHAPGGGRRTGRGSGACCWSSTSSSSCSPSAGARTSGGRSSPRCTRLPPPADGRAPAALVVLLVRADFEARLADYPLLAAAVQDRYLLTA